jgi:hypothetical protein
MRSRTIPAPIGCTVAALIHRCASHALTALEKSAGASDCR